MKAKQASAIAIAARSNISAHSFDVLLRASGGATELLGDSRRRAGLSSRAAADLDACWL
jgi:hypothetical protein